MGIPEHFSRDVAQRCRFLIERLRPCIPLLNADQFGGPLQTTFLLAMATPMIVLPIDRIFLPGEGRARVADDTVLNPDLAQQVGNVLGDEQAFMAAPFFHAGRWRYVPDYPGFNVARGLPQELRDQLSKDAAIQTAQETPTKNILLDLRNALAHGGVAYLDKYGQNVEREAVMFAFIAKKSLKSENFNILRIHEDDFRTFLIAWAEWLSEGIGLERRYDFRAA